MRLFLRLLLWAWFLTALVAGQREWLAWRPAWLTPIVALLAAALLLAVAFGFGPLRAAVGRLDLRPLVLLHLVRFYGVVLLALHERGALPYLLAIPAGWGDIVTALLAAGAMLLPMAAELRRHVVVVWNTIGFVDLLLFLGVALRIALVHPWQLTALQRLPLSLLPTFVAPLLLATHVIIFVRLARRPAETAPPA